jgi:hypothetical protein
VPAGDLITLDYQVELRGLLMGKGTTFGIGPVPQMIEGLGTPRPKTADLDYTDADGAYGGKDRRDVRVVTVPLVIRETTSALAMTRLDELNDAWDVSIVDIPLYVRLPGWGKFHVNGRPRGLTADLGGVQWGAIEAMGTFYCPTPTITVP